MAAFTVTQYEAICAAIGSGELIVKYDGKQVQYRSMDELLKARAAIAADLQAAGLLASATRGGTTYAAYDRE